MTQDPASEAIQQLRDELREAIIEGADKDIVFTPNSIDIELGVSFSAEAKASGGFKLLAFLDVSGEATAGRPAIITAISPRYHLDVGRRRRRSRASSGPNFKTHRRTVS